MLKKLFAILLTLSMLFTMAFVASAEENTESEDFILGSKENITGTILPDIATRADQTIIDGGTTYHALFSMRATEVYDLLTSDAGSKSFTTAKLPYGCKYILIRATLNHSTSNALASYDSIYFGICKYSYVNGGTYVAVDGIRFNATRGVLSSGKLEVSRLDSKVTYYSFIKNMVTSSSGYVSGNLTIYASGS